MPDCVGCHVQRIQAYDKPTGLNTYRLIAPNLSQVAAQKDAQLSQVIHGRFDRKLLFLPST